MNEFVWYNKKQYFCKNLGVSKQRYHKTEKQIQIEIPKKAETYDNFIDIYAKVQALSFSFGRRYRFRR